MTEQEDNFGPGLFGTKMVSIFVGKKRKEFTVHRKLICEKSQYFRGLLEGGFKEAREEEDGNGVHLDENPDAFEILVNCLYRGGFPKESRLVLGPQTRPLKGMLLFYILADKFLLDDSFKLDTITSYVETFVKRVQVGARNKHFFHVPRDGAPDPNDINRGLVSLSDEDPFHLILLDTVYCVYLCGQDLYPALCDRWLVKCLQDVPAASTVRLCRMLSTQNRWGPSDPARVAFDDLGKLQMLNAPRYRVGYFVGMARAAETERKKKEEVVKDSDSPARKRVYPPPPSY